MRDTSEYKGKMMCHSYINGPLMHNPSGASRVPSLVLARSHSAVNIPDHGRPHTDCYCNSYTYQIIDIDTSRITTHNLQQQLEWVKGHAQIRPESGALRGGLSSEYVRLTEIKN